MTAAKAPPEKQRETVSISPPNFEVATFTLRGTSPLMQHRFSTKVGALLREKMEAGSTTRKGSAKTARDFNADYENAQFRSTEGWNGFPASAMRNASIDVCRMVGFKMTHAKMSFFVLAEGLDEHDGIPLIRIHGEPEMSVMPVRNATGVIDLRARPMWRQWSAKPRIRFDADQFKLADIANLVARAGQQVGIGEGRPFSKSSNGMGFGTFEVE